MLKKNLYKITVSHVQYKQIIILKKKKEMKLLD